MRTLAAGLLIGLLGLSPGTLAQTPARTSAAAQPARKPAQPPAKTSAPASLITAELLSGLEFRNIGPAIMSGRISDIVMNPKRRATWYVAVGSGGVWKTENAGTTWTPIFDAQGAYSIGCITLDPANPETVWVGTGENVSGRHVGYGDGVYKSLNGGKTWTNTGLKNSEHIARILVDPRNPLVVYAAAEGPLWSPGGERGLYKSADGGKTWAISLEISKDTGVTSAEMDPSNPDVLYAAAYQRRRTVAAFVGGGPESAIYKSDDAGKTWRKLEVGLPKGDVGKIGLAVSPIDPRVVYATVEASPDERGFYRSTNKGESFEKRSPFISGGTGPHYYQEIFADPNTFDRVYQMNPGLMVTSDGGKTFVRVPEKNKHGDNHAMAFVKGDPDYILNGSDGGVYETHDRGETWRFFENLPVTQFYKLALDNALPFYNVHGGAQDNGSQMGPSRTLNANGISNFDWTITYGADGYAIAVDPADPDTVYLEWQEGNLLRYDRKSHETIYISPKPGPGDPPLRFNWDSPVVVSPHAHTRIYYASQYVWRSDDRGDSWKQISPDLTRGIFRLTQPIMGRTWSADALWDHGAMSMFSTITTISESPLVEGLIYAGTDDGLIQVTEDGGATWRKSDKLPGVPDNFFVNRIRASKTDKDAVFAAVDSHKTGDYAPYVLRSDDRGRTWTSISGDLPARTLVWAVVQDHVKRELLFAGTEFGIYTTLNGGKNWHKLGGGVPVISFRDIEIHERENDLVGASFGRSFFVLDDYSPLRQIDEAALAGPAILFPVKKALSYIPLRPIDSPAKNSLGETFYLAPNPPFGAVFTYYLKDDLKPAAEARREEEKKLVKDGKPVTFPGWDALRKEEQELKPEIGTDRDGRDGPGGAPHHGAGGQRPAPRRVGSPLSRRRSDAAGVAVARVVGVRPAGSAGGPGHVHRDVGEEGRWRAHAARLAEDVRRRLADPRHAARERQGRAAGLPEEGRRASAGDDGHRGGRRGSAEEPLLHAEGPARHAEGRSEADGAGHDHRNGHPRGDAGAVGRFDRRPAERGKTAFADGQGQHPDGIDGAGHKDGVARLRDCGRWLQCGARETSRAHRPGPAQSGDGDGVSRRPVDARPRPARVEEMKMEAALQPAYAPAIRPRVP